MYAHYDSCARAHFFDALGDRLKTVNNWIVGGDLDNDKMNDGSKVNLRNILQEKDLFDIWSTVHSDVPGYTHFHKVSKQASRIDYVFISSNLLSSVFDMCTILHSLSGHHIVNLKLQDLHTRHGNGR